MTEPEIIDGDFDCRRREGALFPRCAETEVTQEHRDQNARESGTDDGRDHVNGNDRLESPLEKDSSWKPAAQ